MLTRIYVRGKGYLDRFLQNQRGVISIEWIMIGLLGVAVIGAIIAYLNKEGGGGEGLGKAVVDKLSSIITDLGKENK